MQIYVSSGSNNQLEALFPFLEPLNIITEYANDTHNYQYCLYLPDMFFHNIELWLVEKIV